MGKHIISVNRHVNEGCTTIEIEEFGIAYRLSNHCPKDWNLRLVSSNGLFIFSSDKIITNFEVQEVVNNYLNKDTVEVV